LKTAARSQSPASLFGAATNVRIAPINGHAETVIAERRTPAGDGPPDRIDELVL